MFFFMITKYSKKQNKSSHAFVYLLHCLFPVLELIRVLIFLLPHGTTLAVSPLSWQDSPTLHIPLHNFVGFLHGHISPVRNVKIEHITYFWWTATALPGTVFVPSTVWMVAITHHCELPAFQFGSILVLLLQFLLHFGVFIFLCKFFLVKLSLCRGRGLVFNSN